MSRFAVIGDPIAHSKSPAMHAAAYRALGLHHTYEAIRVAPGDLEALVARVRSGELSGVNVTVPHKIAVLDFVDDVETTARMCGAANTLVRTPDGRVVAHNTDVAALAAEIAALSPGFGGAGDTAIVLGSGGAARSAIVALSVFLGVGHVAVRARAFSEEGARARFDEAIGDTLAQAETTCTLLISPLEPDGRAEARAGCVVQATSAGMTGADSGQGVAEAIDWAALRDDAVALDVVYAPPETPFLRAAAPRRRANGLGMLARQGAVAFELWLGVPAPYDAMLRALA